MEIPIKKFADANNKSIAAFVVVNPFEDRFSYNLRVKENDEERCYLHLYDGITDLFYFNDLFKFGKWKRQNMLIISGKEKQTEFHVDIAKCNLQVVKLTNLPTAPLYELMKANLSENQGAQARQGWLKSMPLEMKDVLDKAKIVWEQKTDDESVN